MQPIQYLLYQIRNQDDPMREHEVECFAEALGCDEEAIHVHDLLSGSPTDDAINSVDAVLIGGSGDYSVVTGGPWLDEALESMRFLHDEGKPTFASCWGFQALARALGGKVVHDLQRAEIGTPDIQLTVAGETDPIFSELGKTFQAQMGHEDIVDEIPSDAQLLASTDRVANQAFTFPGKLIYATQFHPELKRDDLLQRLKAYPQYVTKITGLRFAEFESQCKETPGANLLLRRFAAAVAREVG